MAKDRPFPEMVQPKFTDPAIAEVFKAFPPQARDGLLALRTMIFEVADGLPQIGPVEESLKWGQPSYATPKVKAATPIRLGVPKTGGFALFTHCQSRVISDFTALHPQQDRIDGNRAVLFDDVAQLNPDRHRQLIHLALTYHLKP